jgi:ATP-dependent Lon protease
VLYIEGTLLPQGKGLTLTGQLGDVMKESAQAARSWVWSHADRLGLELERFKDTGLHIHVPAGAIPKDGPSAGITMATAVASLYSGCPARSDTAMTGEITLTGLVLPIGGVKEKVLAARRAGIKRIILPDANRKDLRDLPEPVRNELEFIFAERIEQVLDAAIPDLHSRLSLVEPKVA